MKTSSSRMIRVGMAGAVWLFSAGCYGSGVSTGVYVGVSGPGPWYGHPGPYGYRGPYGYPGRVGGSVEARRHTLGPDVEECCQVPVDEQSYV